MTVGLVYHPDYLKHDTGHGHPERPQRLTWIMKGLEKDGALQRVTPLSPAPAALDTVHLVHPPAYVDELKVAARRAPTALDPDTTISPASFDVALLAAGGVTTAIDAVCQGKLTRALVLVRPPGHHATATRAMGFCLLNNVAIGARYAQRAHQLARIAILDWDVHHGNGTQDIFYDDPSVFYCSLHQYPYYPGSGAASETGGGAGAGTTLNCPMPAGSGDDEYLATLDRTVLPRLRTFQPDLLMISAGFDGHRDDPLAAINLTEAGYAAMTERAVALAIASCQGRIVSVLEGGYHPRALPASVAAHLKGLLAANER